MRLYTRFLAFGVLSSLLIVLSFGLFQATAQEAVGQVRFIHVVPTVGPIDIYINDALIISNLDYGAATGYLTAPEGEHALSATLHQETTTLWTQTLSVQFGKPGTYVASSLEAPQFLLYQDALAPLDFGGARFMIIHAIEGAPAIDVEVDGAVLVTGVAYSQFLGTIDAPAATYQIAALITETSEAVLPATPVGLVAGTSQFLIVYGTPDDPQVLIASTPTTLDSDGGFVRLAHGVADAPAVDVYLDNTLIVPALAFGSYTEHIGLPAGDYAVELRVAGSDETLLTSEATVSSGAAATIVALGTPEDLSIGVFSDDIGGINETTALLSVINAVPGESAVTVTLDDGTEVTAELPFGESSSVISSPAVIASPSLTLAIDGASPTIALDPVTFYGGVYYNLFVFGGSSPRLVIAPTTLAQGLGSAPGAGAAVIAQPEPTSEVVQIPPTPESQATQPTAVPQPTIPPTTPTPALPTARIVLDPNANLQLRQYPDSNALSLGLAPSGTVLQVNGREGAPIDVNGAELPGPDGQPFVDPATLLTNEQADLDPQNTWLNILYTTPDGGTIVAWVNAQYLEVRAPDGDNQRLAELPTVPGNEPGEATDTAVTPPPVAENRVTVVVIGLEPTINLNIRRIPDPNGEVLARVPNDTVLEFLGLGASGNWVFIRYVSPEGAIVTGWVNVAFVEFRFRDQRTDRETLSGRGLLLPADEATERGEVTQGAVPVTQPTRDPLRDVYVGDVIVDANANLNLRRTPNDQAEVVARIPAGSRVVVVGRTSDSRWLQTTFENQTGWIAASFVRLSFNGVSADPAELPILDTGIAVPTVPGVVPTATNAG